MTDEITLERLLGDFLKMTREQARTTGDVYPHVLVCAHPGTPDPDGPGLHVHALAVPAGELLPAVAECWHRGRYRMIAYGRDRYALPDQGTTLGNVLTYVAIDLARVVEDPNAAIRFGIFEYDLGNVLEPVTDNEHWNDVIHREIETLLRLIDRRIVDHARAVEDALRESLEVAADDEAGTAIVWEWGTHVDARQRPPRVSELDPWNASELEPREGRRRLVAYVLGRRKVPADELHRWMERHGWTKGQGRGDLSRLVREGALARYQTGKSYGYVPGRRAARAAGEEG